MKNVKVPGNFPGRLCGTFEFFFAFFIYVNFVNIQESDLLG